MASQSTAPLQESNHQVPCDPFDGVNPTNGNLVPNGVPGSGLNRNNMEWTAEEQAILEDGLATYASVPDIVLRYCKIAFHLRSKTARDIAMRCRWMSDHVLTHKKENVKRRKEDKPKEKKERVLDPSAKTLPFVAKPSNPQYAAPMMPVESDDGLSFKVIDGVSVELLRQNAKVFDQISTNFSTGRVEDLQVNIGLFAQTRDNILKLMNELNDMPEEMKQMPPLPLKLNEELANKMFSSPNLLSTNLQMPLPSLPGSDLPGLNVQGSNLRPGFSLPGSNLPGSDLSSPNTQGGSLSNANVRGPNYQPGFNLTVRSHHFPGSNLSEPDFQQGVNLHRSNVSDSNLSSEKTKFSIPDVQGPTSLQGSRFSGGCLPLPGSSLYGGTANPGPILPRENFSNPNFSVQNHQGVRDPPM